MKAPSQKKLRERLIALQGDRTHVKAASDIYTPLRTYKNWISGAAPIRGLLRAYIETWEELRRAEAEIDALNKMF